MSLTVAEKEIVHGKKLAKDGAESIWGWGTPAGSFRAQRRAKLIAWGGRLKTNTRTLEIGCGTGLFTEMFARTGAKITAVDISGDLLKIARERNLPPHTVQFLEKPFEECDVDGPFDAIIGSSILHHLDLDKAIPKFFSLLRHGGHISFAEPNMLNPQIMAQKNIPWLKEWLGDSPDETAFFRWALEKKFNVAGFTDIIINPFDWLHPATPIKLINIIIKIGECLESIPCIREFAGSLHICCRRP